MTPNRAPAEAGADPGAQGAQRSAVRWIAIGFTISAVASLALAVVYFLGGQPQLEGILLAVALGGIGVGLGLWAAELLPQGPFVEARKALHDTPADREEAEEAFEGDPEPVERRSFLLKMLGVAVTALGVAALFPIRSLGVRPGRELFKTHWTPGARAVTRAGTPLTVNDLDVGGLLTVFPEGHLDAADSQTIIIRLDEGEYEDPPGREGWAPQGFVGYSKICTHAGCPVGLYQQETRELFCPCHQSIFQVLQGAEPAGGPATRPLPQLPLGFDDEGYLIATGDFPEPVGPGFWDRDSD